MKQKYIKKYKIVTFVTVTIVIKTRQFLKIKLNQKKVKKKVFLKIKDIWQEYTFSYDLEGLKTYRGSLVSEGLIIPGLLTA